MHSTLNRFAPSGSIKADKLDLAAVSKLIVEKTNDFRKEQKRNTVAVDSKLTDAARYFADYLADNDKFGHTADGNRPADRAKKFGYDYCIVLENIAYEYKSSGFTAEELSKAFVEGWKNSPGHRRNMLDRDVTDTGVAVARSDKSGYYYAVQMFGRPKSMAIEFQVANESDATIEYQMEDQKFPLPPGYTRTHTRCRPAEATFELPAATDGDKGERKTVKPANGDRFVITRSKGKYVLKKG